MIKRVVRWVLLPGLGLLLILVALANVLAEPQAFRPQDFAAVPITLPSGEQLPFEAYVERLEQGDAIRVGPNTTRKLITKDEGATILALGATPGAVFTPSM